MLQTRGRGLSCTLPSGERIRVLPEHRYLSWNPAEYAAFRRSVTPGSVALDVGANVGAYAVLFGQWVGPSGHVYAFEPSPGPLRGLERHISLNALGSVVEAVGAAVADHDGAGELIVAGTAGESRLAGTSERSVTVTVPIVTIDGFCAREGIQPALIKIDVEGAELAVLRGAHETIRRGGDALAVFVELHPSIWTLTGITRGDFDAELDRQGLKVDPLTADDPWGVEGMVVRLVRR
jgi:FkbM family methyltransferase